MPVDLLHLLRNLRRSPGSAGAAILTLALTLGAAVAIFAVVDAVVLTPPPFADPEALVTLGETPAEGPAGAPRAVRYRTFEAWRGRARPLAAVEAFDGTNLTLTELGVAERVKANDVTPGFLSLLGVTPVLGRAFEDADIGGPVVIVSHAFWRGKLATDPSVVGRQLVLGGRAHTIVGVLPEHFFFGLGAADVWRPLPLTPAQAARDGYRVNVIARLEGNASASDLAGALDEVSRAASPPARVVATDVGTAIAGDRTKTLSVLAGAAAIALLLAFANLAGLLIVRSIDRRRELAVRSALGARPSEIVRQLLLETLALVAMGALGGVLLALWLTPALGTLALGQLGATANRAVTVSWRVIAAVSIMALACGCLCGTVPAVGAARRSVADVLRRGLTPPKRELALRRLFVTGEVTLAFVLLVSMTLLGRALVGVLHVNPGFDDRGVLTLQVSLPRAAYPTPDRMISFYSTLQSDLGETFGPGAISIVDELPLTGDGDAVC